MRQIDVRIIAATNRDLRAEVLALRFREDLFYRLNSTQIRLPSLVERLDDIPLLIQCFVKKCNRQYGKNISGLTRRAQTALLQYSWPGNVRELENVVSTACMTTTNDFIDFADLPEDLQSQRNRSAERKDWKPLSLEAVRKLHIKHELEMYHGHRIRAARALGIGRTSLYRHLRKDSRDTGAHEKSRGAIA